MKNKKSMSAFGVIITASISLILLFVFIGPIIKGIFVDKQVAYAGGKTEDITKDCDSDTIIGFSDPCPCNPKIPKPIKLESGNTCGYPDVGATRRCPILCKE